MVLAINNRILKQWVCSLDGISGAKFSCPFPLSADEKEFVLEWLALIRKQVERDAFKEVADRGDPPVAENEPLV